MAHLATNRFNYWGQLGILLAFLGVGLIIGGIASLLPLIGKINISDITSGSGAGIIDKLMKPENANALRLMQFITTLFLFFFPPVVYAWVCHAKPFKHLGFTNSINLKQVFLVVLIMIACLPVVGALQELTEMLPWSKETLQKFKIAEETYNKQVAVMARMDNFSDYIISVIIIALLPAVFEEILFRGALQNLFSRWFKMPIVAIVVTSIIFSAVHGSYLGFLSRFALGFVLGWMYYRTSNIWLNIIGHLFNNALAITVLYVVSKPGQPIDPSKIDDRFPLWVGAVGLLALIAVFKYFDKEVQPIINRPGEEELIESHSSLNNPFENVVHKEDSSSS